MVNIREYGIVFQKVNSGGIAQISVFDSTLGLYITETGATSVFPAFRYFDTYQSTSYTTLEGACVYWITLTAGHLYNIIACNSGTYNPLAVAPYQIQILGFLDSEPLVIDDLVENTITLSDDGFPTATYTYTLLNQSTVDTAQTQPFNGDDSTTLFTLSGNNHAASFERFSIDGGLTWRYPDDYEITWGSNAPNYTDQTIDANYQFSIQFLDTAPPVGVGNVLIKYYPQANLAVFKLTVKQPHDELNSYKNYYSHVVMQDYGIGFIN